MFFRQRQRVAVVTLSAARFPVLLFMNAAELLHLGQRDVQRSVRLAAPIVIRNQPVNLLPESIHARQLLRLLTAAPSWPGAS